MGVVNPRYPHWCKIVRKITDDPLEDEEDFNPLEDSSVKRVSGFEEDYDPMGSDNESNDQENSSEENPTQEENVSTSQTIVIYEGECRSYKINTTSDKGEVVTSQRGLALPLNQDAWDALGIVPQEGDEIVVEHGTTFKEYGRVVDKNIATASFAGTHLVWRYGRN